MFMQKFLKGCRFVHGWLGFFVLPWVVVIGLTGVYLNHSRVIYPLLVSEYSEAGFSTLQTLERGTRKDAESLHQQYWPNQAITKIWNEPYHSRPAIYVRNNKGLTILSVTTGHYYIKSRYLRKTFSPSGEKLHTKIYWGAVFKDFHQSGWLGWGMGTWFADIVGGAMVVFGFTGLFMWGVPRIRKLRTLLNG